LLEELGFKVLETRHRVVVNGVEIGEVDVIAEDGEGTRWAVEVKAGKLDVNGIRQAYVNAVVLGLKPMVVCKGFADDAARQLAELLGVRVIQLSDVFLVEDEELELVVKEAVEDAMAGLIEVVFGEFPQLKEEHARILEAIAVSQTMDEAASRLGVGIDELSKKLSEIRSLGIIPRWAKKWSTVRRIAQLIAARRSLQSIIDEYRRLAEETKLLSQQVQQLSASMKTLVSQLTKASEALAKLTQQLHSKTAQPEAQQTV